MNLKVTTPSFFVSEMLHAKRSRMRPDISLRGFILICKADLMAGALIKMALCQKISKDSGKILFSLSGNFNCFSPQCCLST